MAGPRPHFILLKVVELPQVGLGQRNHPGVRLGCVQQQGTPKPQEVGVTAAPASLTWHVVSLQCLRSPKVRPSSFLAEVASQGLQLVSRCLLHM
eukprot:symbB.v1.2.013101.t1/scaffold919.1/size152209/13